MSYCSPLRSGVGHWHAAKCTWWPLTFYLDLDLDLDMSKNTLWPQTSTLAWICQKMYLMTFDLDLDLSKMIDGLRPRLWPRYVTCMSRDLDLDLDLDLWPWPVKVIMRPNCQVLSTVVHGDHASLWHRYGNLEWRWKEYSLRNVGRTDARTQRWFYTLSNYIRRTIISSFRYRYFLFSFFCIRLPPVI